MKKKSNLRNIVRKLSRETKREKIWKKKVRKATSLKRYGKISKKVFRRMLKSIPNKEYKIEVEDVESGGNAIEDKVVNAEDEVVKAKEMVEPNSLVEEKNSEVYQGDSGKYSSPAKKEESLVIYKENLKEGSMRRGVKQIMEAYFIKLNALTKGPFRKMDASYNRMKDIFIGKYN